jgi:4-carboxymuconolactone decarboxylase
VVTASRLPLLPPESLTEEQTALYRAITRGRRSAGARLFEITGSAGELLGPFSAMIVHPTIGAPLQRLGEALRYDSTLPPSVREISIVTVAAELGSEYEWYAHSAVARSLGVPEYVLEELRTGGQPRELSQEEECACALSRGLLRRNRLSEAEYLRLRAVLAEKWIIEVASIVGYYSLLAGLLQTFEVGLPCGVPTSFEEPPDEDRQRRRLAGSHGGDG